MKPFARELARSVLFPFAEHIWSALFAVVGAVLRPKASRQTWAGGERVLVVAPHPDDETLGCGGTIALHSRRGDAVCIVIVTDGGSSRAGGISREEMVALRAPEAERATARLGRIELVQLSLPEGHWAEGDLQPVLRPLIETFRPTLLYTPSCVDFHPEHLKVAREVARTLEQTEPGGTLRVRVYELQVPLTPLLANVVVGVGQTKASKVLALEEYHTQQGSFTWVPRHARYLRLLYRSRVDVEVFWELAPREYRRLVLLLAPTRQVFRSVRLRPFTDGIAWLIGLRERVRLKLGVDKS